ncbi:MAG: LytTR family DNA-binding domain-containing protein [Pseudomonadota bacterium]
MAATQPLAKRERRIVSFIDPFGADGFFVVLLSVAVFAIIGPFDTYERLELQERAVFWLSAVMTGYLCVWLLSGTDTLWGTPFGLTSVPRFLTTTVTASIMMAPIIIWFAGDSFLSPDKAWTVPRFALQVFPICLIVSTSLVASQKIKQFRSISNVQDNRIAARSKRPADKDELTKELKDKPSIGAVGREPEAFQTPNKSDAVPSVTVRSRLHSKLSPSFRTGDIIALSAEDHYVRVLTTKGSQLLLMRMSDAIENLDGIDGARVHRSWWVARKFVTGSRKLGSAFELTVADTSQTVPIARRRLPALRAAGWPIKS